MGLAAMPKGAGLVNFCMENNVNFVGIHIQQLMMEELETSITIYVWGQPIIELETVKACRKFGGILSFGTHKYMTWYNQYLVLDSLLLA